MTDELLDVALEAAAAAGRLLLDRFGGPARGVEAKTTSTDLVSDADRDAESAILGVLRNARPEDGLVAEEGSDRPSRTGLRWVVDPLDGTVNYLFGIPHWAVSVAVEDDDGPLVGVVLDPCREERFTAVRGRGAELDGRPIRTAEKSDLSQALIGTGFAYAPQVRAEQAAVLSRLIGRVRDIRRAGTASLDLAWTACGRLDGFYETGLKPWDLAAGSLIVREAGGRTGPLPRPIAGDRGIVATGPGIHDALLEALELAVGSAR